MIGEAEFDRLACLVVKGVFENGGGDAGVHVIERDEWIPRGDGYVQWDFGMGKCDAPEGITACENALAEPGKAFMSAVAVTLGLEPLVIEGVMHFC